MRIDVVPCHPYKRPESVLVLIHSLDARVLLLERVSPSGYWQSVTGSLEWGEEAPQAAVREVQEETGLLVADKILDCAYANRFAIVPPWRERYAPGIENNTEYVFRVEYSTPVDFQLNLAEHQRGQWFYVDEALERVGSHTNREAIERFVRKK